MAYNSTRSSEDDHSDEKTAYSSLRQTCKFPLIGRRQWYIQLLSASNPSTEHDRRHLSEQSTNFVEPTISTTVPQSISFLSTLSSFSLSTTATGDAQSAVHSPSSSSLVLIPSDVASANGHLSTNTPVRSSTKIEIGIIVGCVLGSLILLLLGIVTWFCLFRNRRRTRRKTGYNNLPSEDGRRYLYSEGNGQYDRYDKHTERGPPDFHRNTVHNPYPPGRQGLSASAQGRSVRFNLTGRVSESSQFMEGRDHDGQEDQTSDIERPISHGIESHFTELGFRSHRNSSMSAFSTSGSSIVSWARTALDFAPNMSSGSLSTNSKARVDISQISEPRRLQRWQPKPPNS